MDADANGLRLQAVGSRDRGLVRHWLRDPHVQRWWGSAATAEASVSMALDSEAALCRLIVLDGQPIGYAQAADVAGLEGARPASLAGGTYACDVFIAVEAHRGKGHGQASLRRLSDEVFATTLALACSVIVSIRNERAVRAYERAGFSWREVWRAPDLGPAWVMLRERPAAGA